MLVISPFGSLASGAARHATEQREQRKGHRRLPQEYALGADQFARFAAYRGQPACKHSASGQARRSTDSVIGIVASGLKRLWDFIDARDIDKHAVSLAIL